VILTPEFTQLFEKVADFQGEVVILTPNKRLSRFLRDRYNGFQTQKQRRAWPSLKAFSLQAWIQQHWDKLSFSAFSPGVSPPRDSAFALLRGNYYSAGNWNSLKMATTTCIY